MIFNSLFYFFTILFIKTEINIFYVQLYCYCSAIIILFRNNFNKNLLYIFVNKCRKFSTYFRPPHIGYRTNATLITVPNACGIIAVRSRMRYFIYHSTMLSSQIKSNFILNLANIFYKA